LKIDVPVLVRGVLRGEEDAAPKLSVSSIQALEDIKLKLPESLRIKVPLHNPDAALLEKLTPSSSAPPARAKSCSISKSPASSAPSLSPTTVLVATSLVGRLT
jgi:DNA polymerase-3 subunit alpha